MAMLLAKMGKNIPLEYHHSPNLMNNEGHTVAYYLLMN